MKSQIILKNIRWLGRHNPGFPPGSAQTAVAELLNPSASILPYRAWLYLEEWAVVGSNLAFFNIDAGATKNVNFQITMPPEERTYPVYLKIWSGDQLLETYRAAEDVVIGAPPTYYPCPYCGATFTTMAALTSHIEEMQGIGPHPPAPPVVTGFSLSLMDILPTLVLWNANFGYKTFDYDPRADSGWLAWNESWIYPSDPLGCTSLRVWALDAQDNILFDVWNKGPIYANRKYAFNCQTLKLWDVTEYPGVIIG